MKPRPTQIEFHVTHSCNFGCVSCTHFSQDGHSGRATPESFLAEVGPWGKRLSPRFFLLLGGEPTMNPQLTDIVKASRRVWDGDTKVLLVTNGWFLHRHPQLPQALKDNDVRLDISIHHDAPEYLAKLEEVKRLCRDWGVTPVFRESFRDWTSVYHGNGRSIMPYTDNDPRSSWKSCVSKWCVQIHEGKLWKCPPMAYLPMQARKFGGLDSAWEPYLAYEPLSPDCSDAEMFSFLRREVESCCAMCPAKLQPFKKPNPVRGAAT